MKSSKEVVESIPIKASISTLDEHEEQIVAKQEIKVKKTKKAYKPNSIAFLDNPLIIKPTLLFL